MHKIIEKKINIASLREEFTSKKPFKYMVIDNFLPDNIAQELLAEFPNANSNLWNVGYDDSGQPVKLAKDNPFEKRMVAISDKNKFPESHRKIFQYFDSQEFLSLLRKITNIDNLLVDTTGRHAGLRGMLDGSHQHIHSDAIIHPQTGLRKRLSAILYLNKEWKKSMGGFLEIWNDNMTECIRKISPDYNRLVVFECTEKSYHGVPETIELEDKNTMRLSLIFSYMSDPAGLKSSRKRAKFVARPTDSKDKEIERLREERESTDQENEHRFM